MDKADWIWMPHPGHLIIGNECRFHLNTCVGDFVVSTVGEYWPDKEVRQIFANSRGIDIVGRGDEWDYDYMQKMGYPEVGVDRKYESMVFQCEKKEDDCCPYRPCEWRELDFDGYNDSTEAYQGHLRLCEKWSNLTKETYTEKDENPGFITAFCEAISKSLKESTE